MSRIALVPDCKGWAFDQWAAGIARHAPSWCTCDILYPGEINDVIADTYDAILNFSWAEVNTRIRKRVVAAVASHNIEHSAWKSTLEKRSPDWRHEDWRACVASRISNQWTAAKVIPKLDGVIAITPKLAKAAAEIPGSHQVKTLPAGIDPELWPCAPLVASERRLVVGWCGQVDPRRPGRKGKEWIVDPLRRRTGRLYDWRINTRGAQHPLSQQEMIAWYREIDVFLVTSISEGTPCTAIEAMSTGRPVLATNVGDMPYVVTTGQTGALLGDYHDEESAEGVIDNAASWLKKLNHARHDVRRMGHNASRVICERRHWRELSPKWLTFVLNG